MTNNTKQLLLQHGTTIDEIEELYKLGFIDYSEDFLEGFIFLISDLDGNQILYSAANNDIYSYSMWKSISKILKERKKPIIMYYDKNKELLFKASKRYGKIEIIENKITFKI